MIAAGFRLSCAVVRTSELTPSQVDRQFELFARHYRRVDPDAFRRDLAAKDWVLILADDEGGLAGFTTIQILDERDAAGRRIRVAFSGNTIIDRSRWGGQELARTWGRFMRELKEREPEIPLYWNLICSGYRTYLYLPLFFREFHPRCDRPTPARDAELIDRLGRARYPSEYSDGIVRVSGPRECLREDLVLPDRAKLSNRHVGYFFSRNPGHGRGDEMVCVAEFSRENLRPAALNLIGWEGR